MRQTFLSFRVLDSRSSRRFIVSLVFIEFQCVWSGRRRFEEDRRRFGKDWRIRGLEFLLRVWGIAEFRFKVFKRPSEFYFVALSYGRVKAWRSLCYLKEGFEVLVWKSIEFADIFTIRSTTIHENIMCHRSWKIESFILLYSILLYCLTSIIGYFTPTSTRIRWLKIDLESRNCNLNIPMGPIWNVVPISQKSLNHRSQIKYLWLK